MSAEQDLEKSLEMILQLEREVYDKAPTLSEQASVLEEDLMGAASESPDPIVRLAKFCLLSEICGAVDFDRMLDARERFQEAFPEHFQHYLAHLDNFGWQMAWPGCLECANFAGKCTAGVSPLETPDSRNRFDKYCTSKSPRIPAGSELGKQPAA